MSTHYAAGFHTNELPAWGRTDFTIMCHASRDSTATPTNSGLIGFGDASNLVFVNSQLDNIRLYDGTVTAGAFNIDTAFHHVALTLAGAVAGVGGTLSVFVDGDTTAKMTATNTAVLPADIFATIGSHLAGGGDQYVGRIAAVKIWNGRALTGAEILTELSKGYIVSATSKWSSHKLQTAVLTDDSGSSHPLVLNGTAPTTDAGDPSAVTVWDDTPADTTVRYSVTQGPVILQTRRKIIGY